MYKPLRHEILKSIMAHIPSSIGRVQKIAVEKEQAQYQPQVIQVNRRYLPALAPLSLTTQVLDQ